MATSERILSVLPHDATVQPVVATRLPQPARPAWLQVFVDYATIFSALALLSYAAHVGLVAIPLYALPHFAVALMLTTILGFVGAYPRRQTPLEIANTEGLVRASWCLAILLAIAGVTRLLASPGVLFLGLGVVFAMLFIEREALNALLRVRRSRDWYVRSATSFAFQINDTGTSTFVHLESGSSQALKRLVDVVGAGLILLVILPLGLVVAALIKLDSEGPVFIRQRRIGRSGVPFSMWKFRSMQADVNRYARSPVSDSDPRLTGLGRALRRMSIDELPQLLNVLNGEMSLVGPRPEMPFIVKEYTAHERLRLNAVPGITGLWQISPARAMPIHENLELDLFYIQHRSFFLDIAIMLRTLTAIVRGIGAW